VKNSSDTSQTLKFVQPAEVASLHAGNRMERSNNRLHSINNAEIGDRVSRAILCIILCMLWEKSGNIKKWMNNNGMTKFNDDELVSC